MQEQTDATSWHIIRNQMAQMEVFERRIEDLRGLLAQDWQFRLSRQKSLLASDAARFEQAGNPGFSAC